MSSLLMGMLAETYIHPGSGQNDGAIDLPVARESVTSYPFIPGSALKGAWRDYAEQSQMSESDIDSIFGYADSAGKLLISDARLLLLPVRSLSKNYFWVTCPLILERLARDIRRVFANKEVNIDIYVEQGQCKTAVTTGDLFLEERCFTAQIDTNKVDPIVEILKTFIPYNVTKTRLKNQLVIINDEDFKWFAENGLNVQARNVLDKDKQSTNLWYEETLPPDTIMTSIISERGMNENSLEKFLEKISLKPYLQVGGNETVGQGWFHVAPIEKV